MKILAKNDRTLNILSVLFLLVLSLGISSFFRIYKQTSSFTILEHSFHLPILYSALATGLIFIFLFLLWVFFANRESQVYSTDYKSVLRENLIVLTPLLLIWIVPLMLKYYLTSEDLKGRLNFLAISAVLSVLFLKLIQINRHKKLNAALENALARFENLHLRKKLLFLFLIAFLAYNLCTYCIVSQGHAFSGDEPYYLLTTHSLYQDQDINVANNYASRDYSYFYPKKYYPHLRLSPYARMGQKGSGYMYPISQPGISALMVPFYWLSHFFEGRVLIFILKGSLSVWAVLLGLQLYLFSREKWGKERLSLTLWCVYSFTTPVLFYAIHIYPEIPIALFSLYIYRKVRSKKPLSGLKMVFLSFLLALFFWFGLKYNMIFWPLLLTSSYFLLKDHKIRWKIVFFLILPLLSLGMNYYYIYYMYGTFNPISIYEGVLSLDKLQEYRSIILKTPIMLRIDSFFDYFLDQRDGLLLYSPLYFFALLGAVEVFRRSRRDLLVFLFIASPFILNYAFFAHRQGASPQGRVLASLSWIGIILVGYFIVHNRKKLYSGLFWFLCSVSLGIAVLLLQNPPYLYQPTTHEYTFRGSELFISLSNLHFYLPGILPSFVKINNLGYIPNYVWLGAIILFISGYLFKKDIPTPKRFSAQAVCTLLVLAVLLSWFSLYPLTTLIFPTKADYGPGKNLGFFRLDRFTRMEDAGEFFLRRDLYDYTFKFTSWRPIEILQLEFGQPEGDFEVEIHLFGTPIFSGRTAYETKTLTLSHPPRYQLKKTNLYLITIRLKHVGGEPLTEKTYSFSIYPEKFMDETR